MSAERAEGLLGGRDAALLVPVRTEGYNSHHHLLLI